MSRVEITESELLDELLRTMPVAPKEAKTVRQLADQHNWSPERVKRALGRIAMRDRLGVHRVQRKRIDGLPGWVPAYTILPERRKKP